MVQYCRWRHALRSKWPFIIIIIITVLPPVVVVVSSFSLISIPCSHPWTLDPRPQVSWFSRISIPCSLPHSSAPATHPVDSLVMVGGPRPEAAGAGGGAIILVVLVWHDPVCPHEVLGRLPGMVDEVLPPVVLRLAAFRGEGAEGGPAFFVQRL